jgi:hypothetical protein
LSADFVEKAVRDFISAEEIGLGIEVSSLVAYPGGDLVNVIVERVRSELVVHDSGSAAMRLSEQGISISKHVSARLVDYAGRFNCRFEGNRVALNCNIDSVGYAVAMVANASRSVADYALEIRRHAESDFRHMVADVLRELIGARLRENEDYEGKSGRKYRVAATILDASESRPIRLISPIASRAVVDHSFAMLSDIKLKYPTLANECVYDETGDVRDEDREFLSSVCEVYAFMEARRHFRELLGA